jgi:hypothetical protein
MFARISYKSFHASPLLRVSLHVDVWIIVFDRTTSLTECRFRVVSTQVLISALRPHILRVFVYFCWNLFKIGHNLVLLHNFSLLPNNIILKLYNTLNEKEVSEVQEAISEQHTLCHSLFSFIIAIHHRWWFVSKEEQLPPKYHTWVFKR